MMINPKFRRLRTLLARFAAADGGNALMLFGLALVPLVGMVGAATDYGRAATARTEMQVAADSVALMLSKEAVGLDAAAVQAKANTYFHALYTRDDVKAIQLTANYTNNGSSHVDITAQGTLDTYFMGILGINDMTIHSASSATWGGIKLRVAFALDNTGSMLSSGKMDALKTATHNALAKLKATAVNADDVYVSIVPFVAAVNVGALKNDQISGNGPQWTRWDQYGHCSYVGDYDTKELCASIGKTWTLDTNKANWNGCVTDRDQDYDTNDNPPVTGVLPSLYVATPYWKCPAAVLPLTNDWTALNAKVDAMVANGGTNQTIGLQWGMVSVTGKGPLPVPPIDPNFKVKQVIILMTDGLNSINRWKVDVNTVDARMAKVCAAVKAAGIDLYTVQVDTDGSGKSQILPSCASATDKFVYMTSATQVITAFDDIIARITALHIEK